MTSDLRRWLASNSSVLYNAGSLVGTTGVNLALGFVFWWLAAHLFSPATVGLASASISAITLLGTIGMLGLGTLLMGELPRRHADQGALIATALLAAGAAAGMLGILFVLVAPHLIIGLRPLAGSLWSDALLVLGASLTAVALVLDQALLGLLRGELQLWRNAIFSSAKLVVLGAAGLWWAGSHGLVILTAWIGGYVISLFVFAGLAALKGQMLGPFYAHYRLLRGLGRAALGHHVLNVTLQITGLTMPLIVTALLSTTAAAYYFTAGTISTLVYAGPIALATVLFSVGAAEPTALSLRLRFSLGLAAILGIVANLALLLVGGRILGLFGRVYAQEATVPLLILSLGVFPLTVREHYAAIRRVHGRPSGGAPLILAGSALKLSMATIGARMDGLIGLAIGLLIAGCVEALVLAPAVVRVAVGGPMKWRRHQVLSAPLSSRIRSPLRMDEG
jgi:O-antigen/teichoic acid export membrane protein